jgi:hypothetical protein
MNYNIHVELDGGAVSKGYDRKTEEDAMKWFELVKGQLSVMPGFVGDVVLLVDRTEVQRERVQGGYYRG